MSDLVCYTVGLNYVTSSNQYFPCGTSNVTGSAGAQACCYAGDYCMQDSICHYTHSVTNGTGYYMAGCTDPTWQDPVCPKQCTSEYGADIIYDTTNDGWDCCVSSEGVLDCQDPSNFTVAAPAPANMVVVMQLNTPVPSEILTTGIGEISSAESIATTSSQALTTSATISVSTVPSTSQAPIYATPTSTRSTTATAAASSGTATKTQAGMNGGAKAGIAVGCVLAALLIVSIAILLYRRRKTQTARATAGYGNVEQSKTASHSTYRESSSSEGMYRQSAYQSQYPLLELMSPDQPSAKKMPGIGVAEMSTGADLEARHELHGDERLAHELPGSKVA